MGRPVRSRSAGTRRPGSQWRPLACGVFESAVPAIACATRPTRPGTAWAEPLVARGAGRKAAGVQPTVFDLGDRVGVLRPIATASVCLRCHGSVGSLSPEVRGYLETAYPGDAGKRLPECESLFLG